MTTVDPPILLKSKLPDLLTTVQLERYVVDAAGNNVRRRVRCPVISNESDPELACKVFEEFSDISADSHLDLSTGDLKFEFFRQCLGGSSRAHWDVAVNNQVGTTDADFTLAIAEWFAHYFDPTAYHDQQQYFLQATKAFSMTVKETATRVEEIIRWMRFMPGAPAAGTPIYSAVDKKMTLYRLMRPNWRTNFDASGNAITEPTYTWDNLIAYMAAQERKDNRQGSGRNNSMTPGYRGRGGRGQGRGGRGFGPGRGGYGRGGGFRRDGYGGYGRGGYGRRIGYQPYGYGQYNQGPAGYYPRYSGYAAGRGAPVGGRGFAPGAAAPPGRGDIIPARGGRGRGRGRGARQMHGLHRHAGYGNRVTRQGSAYMTDTTNSGANSESFDSAAAESQDSSQADFPVEEDMYYAGDEEQFPEREGFGQEFDDAGFGYEEEFGGYGDY